MLEACVFTEDPPSATMAAEVTLSLGDHPGGPLRLVEPTPSEKSRLEDFGVEYAEPELVVDGETKTATFLVIDAETDEYGRMTVVSVPGEKLQYQLDYFEVG